MKFSFFTILLILSASLVFAADGISIDQSVCPVMEGNPISKDIFVEYQGKKVFFCCENCKSQFLKEPGKYLAKLPQFSPIAASAAQTIVGEPTNNKFNFAVLIAPFGILTFFFLTCSLLSGLFMGKNRKLLFPWHKRLAITAFLMAICHLICLAFAG